MQFTKASFIYKLQYIGVRFIKRWILLFCLSMLLMLSVFIRNRLPLMNDTRVMTQALQNQMKDSVLMSQNQIEVINLKNVIEIEDVEYIFEEGVGETAVHESGVNDTQETLILDLTAKNLNVSDEGAKSSVREAPVQLDHQTSREQEGQVEKKFKPLRIKYNDNGCPLVDAVTIDSHGGLSSLMYEYANLLGFCNNMQCLPLLQDRMHAKLTRYFKKLSAREVGSVRDCPSITSFLFSFEETARAISKNKASGDEYRLYHMLSFSNAAAYFMPFRQVLLNEFHFKRLTMVEAVESLRNISKTYNSSTLIGVHIKKLDYPNDFIKLYLNKALKHMASKHPHSVFVILSDDLRWSKAQLENQPYMIAFPGNGDTKSPGLDLALLLHCDHTILTSGLFGFWGAYLSSGDVIYPLDFKDSNSPVRFLIMKYNNTRWNPLSIK